MLKLLFTALLLGYASWQDVKTREIEEKVWLVMGIAGVATTAYDAFMAKDIHIFLNMGLVVAGAAILMVLLYKLGLFGFADVEAFVALSTLYPFKQGMIMPFPLSIFNNAVLITAFLPLGIFIRNLTAPPDFSGVHDRIYKKIMLLFLGYRIPLTSLDENTFPLIWNGTVRLFVPLEYDFSEYLKKAEEEGLREVWVTPGIPFILSITGGFFLAYFWGDAILKLVFLLLR